MHKGWARGSLRTFLTVVVAVLTSVVVVVGGCAAPQSNEPQIVPKLVDLKPGRIEVPMTISPRSLPIVKVGGTSEITMTDPATGKPTIREELPMILDTGAAFTMVSTDAARRQGVSPRNLHITGMGAGGHTRKLPVARYGRLAVGGANFYEVDVAVSEETPFGPVSDALGAPKIEGALGKSLFLDVLLGIDFERKRIVIEYGSLPPVDNKEILPLNIGAGGRLLVPVHFGGRESWCLIDTGASAGLTVPEWCKSSFPGTEKSIPGYRVIFHGGEADSDLARLRDDLRIGKHVIKRPVASVGVGFDPVIGSEYLKHFVVTIDQKNRRVRFVRKSTAPIVVPPILIAGFRLDPDTGVVIGIMPTSKAERSGLKVGDKVTKLDGVAFDKITEADVDRLIAQDRVVLDVVPQGGGKTTKITVPYTELLP